MRINTIPPPDNPDTFLSAGGSRSTPPECLEFLLLQLEAVAGASQLALGGKEIHVGAHVLLGGARAKRISDFEMPSTHSDTCIQ